MITIDGSVGEGGGQVLRTSLTLSLLTGEPVRVVNIRARRGRPGLLRQHLTAATAAAEIGDGRLDGAALGSMGLTLTPGRVRAGTWRFDIGSAGSTTLVAQTVLLPLLLRADGPAKVLLAGGTHNPLAPSHRFLEASFLPALAAMGAQARVELDRWGFYPAGGGWITVHTTPSALRPLQRTTRGPIRAWRAEAWVSALPRRIGEREVATLLAGLDLPPGAGRVGEVEDPRGPGNVAWVEADHDAGTTVVTGIGERGVPAEEVARRIVAEAVRWRDADVPVDEHLADQLLLPLALAGEGELRIGAPSEHTLTNAAVIRAFLDVPVAVVPDGAAWRVVVGPEAAGHPPDAARLMRVR